MNYAFLRRQHMRRRHVAAALGGGGEFHPTSLTGLVALYDVSDLTSLRVERTGASASTPASVNGVVGTVLDRSGNGNHAIAPTDAGRPILRQSGSLYYLEFDGVDDWLIIANTALLAAELDALICEAMTWRAVDSHPYSIGTNPVDKSLNCLLQSSANTYRIGVDTTGGASVFVNGTSVDLGAPFVNELDWTRSTGTLLGKRNGVTNATVATFAADLETPTTSYVIAGAGGITDRAASMNLYARAYYSRTGLSAEDKTNIRSWMAGKAGVTL